MEKIRTANNSVIGSAKYILLGPSNNVAPGSKACIAQGNRDSTVAIPTGSFHRRDIGVSQKTIRANGIVIESKGAHIMKP